MTKAEILNLSVTERIQLVEEIWDSIGDSPEGVSVTDNQRMELDRRLETYCAGNVAAVPWQEVRDRLQNR